MSWKKLRWRSRIYLVAFFLVLLTIGLEIVSRAYWAIGRKVPLFHTTRIWNSFYEELTTSGVDGAPTARNHESYEVLLLGGSTMYQSADEMNAKLAPALESHTGRAVRVTNLAWYGRNSLDSRLKYEHIADKRFDLVLLYDGFNDVRMNNTPPGAFRADYSHVARYAELQALSRRQELGWITLPFTAKFLASSVRRQIGLFPETDLKWSSVNEIHSPEAFEANVEAIVRTAEQRGDTLVLMTFAYHIPDNYTDAAYEAGQLDFATEKFLSLEHWGERQAVIRAVDGHNEAVRRVAQRNNVLLVDQVARLPARREHFRDPCHLTAEGNRLYVDNIIEALGLRTQNGSTHAP
jgi:hypothetical protein